MPSLLAFATFASVALAAISHPLLHLPDVDGTDRTPLKVEKGHATALFFVTNDCPISNYYSHEIRRICDEFGPKGLSCALVYTDPTLSDAEARKHAERVETQVRRAQVERWSWRSGHGRMLRWDCRCGIV